MSKLTALHFHPKRIAYMGVCLLGASVLFFLFLFFLFQSEEDLSNITVRKVKTVVEKAPYSFSLGLKGDGIIFPIPDLQEEMTFSFDPPRPDGVTVEKRLLVRLKKAEEFKRVVLPCRIDLEFQQDRLKFAKQESPFWLELTLGASEKIEGKWNICIAENQVHQGTLVLEGTASPLQGSQEFAEGSPFRVLGEGKWLGRGLFQKEMERLEIKPNEFLDLKVGDWLVWKESKWEKGLASKEYPIAHIASILSKMMLIEGWDGDGHVRLSLGFVPVPFKVKPEDLFSSLRIRSEKQVSCVLEKQCMVLKVGDWVLKQSGRWKILRKKEEREAFLHGKLLGELFIFDQILHKSGQKMMQGRLVNASRTQEFPLELTAVGSSRGSQKRGSK